MRKPALITLLGLLGLLTILLLWFIGKDFLAEKALEQPAHARMLFIGNSFTNNNELDQLVASLASELGPEWNEIYATRVAPAGYRWIDHLHDTENETAESPLRQLLVTGSDAARDWDLVVLQEQSQILGFGAQSPETAESRSAAAQLNQYAQNTGATVMLMLTWGYANGDPRNATLYPDYATMQFNITQGTYDLANQLSASGNPVFVIPAGRGFQLVYRDLANDAQDPLATNSLFRQLYAEDGQHPSLAGSYLAACIVVAAYTGESVADIEWQPRDLDGQYAEYLRSVADRVVFGAEFPPQPYPWSAQR
ncbi:MAG: hypothetical protein H6657_20575 [Ardenticatenaceae bacterium]|nr:hypothetical protein [Anaerolineales bacterium]MCB8979813.1 hypothetical protein [Ardenticatenaceae bacterium]